MTDKEKKKLSFNLRVNLFMLKVTRHWLRIALMVVGLYATLPLVAPTLMQFGFTAPANVLYTLYSPMCHQFSFRSVFLYGEQNFYPREIVGTDLRPYEAYAAEIEELNPGSSPTEFTLEFFMPARAFRGNEQMGYKMTLCARDAAIYLTMFMGGLIYAIPSVRKRILPIPLWIYVIAGLGPIGLDGFSQLLSYEPFNFWAVRETAPFFRLATGAMFGLMNAWLAFPYLERAMWDSRRDIVDKLVEEQIEF
ncbi:MAG: DUF2085 domain-containing protein [Anaerolineae bacterium]|nr:DUF2085 domain-containing protein [Anaerolineae bacterium]